MQVEALVAAVLQSFRRVDVLVSNAAVMRSSVFLDHSERDWDDVMRVNLKAVFLVIIAVT